MKDAQKVFNAKRSARHNTALFSDKKNKRRRGSYVLYYISLAILVLVVLFVLSLTVFFKVDTIKISGQSRYKEADIIAASGIKAGVNLFTVNVKSANNNITEKLPYIEEVKISKNLPGKLVINVKEAAAVAQIESNGLVVINSSNKVLEIISGKPKKGIPVIRGVSLTSNEAGKTAEYKNNDIKGYLNTIFKGLEKAGISKVSVINFNGSFDVYITYNNKILFQLGSTADIDIKLKYAQNIVSKPENSSLVGVLNLSRLPNLENQTYFTRSELKPAEVADVF